MSETKFTPTPWEILDDAIVFFEPVCCGNDVVYGGCCGCPDASPVHIASFSNEADANLIAAAPDLYEALNSCACELAHLIKQLKIREKSIVVTTYNKALAALAKARGEA